MKSEPIAAGKSSFNTIDLKKLISMLHLKDETELLDVGCGVGNYAVAIAAEMGTHGTVHAVDLWEGGIEELNRKILVQNIPNICPYLADAAERIPLEQESIDICLMATVLHDFARGGIEAGVLREVHRVLKPEGRVAVLELNKDDDPPGPPKNIRLSPLDVHRLLDKHNFNMLKTEEMGEHCHLSLFTKRP